jgi:hypothetical protein
MQNNTYLIQGKEYTRESLDKEISNLEEYLKNITEVKYNQFPYLKQQKERLDLLKSIK